MAWVTPVRVVFQRVVTRGAWIDTYQGPADTQKAPRELVLNTNSAAARSCPYIPDPRERDQLDDGSRKNYIRRTVTGILVFE